MVTFPALVFDDATARLLAQALREADSALRDVGILRRGAVETAADDFSGPYADLFTAGATLEQDDRVRLTRALAELSDDIELARQAAGEERARRKSLTEWHKREEERERRRRVDFLTGVGANVDAVFDPKPSEYAILPPSLNPAFSARERRRTHTGASSGKTSARPANLRVYVAQAGVGNLTIEEHLTDVRTSWTTYSSACTWAPLTGAGLMTGFERYLAENRADATWMDQVATAFESAGGTSLSSGALALAATAVSPMSDRELLAALTSLPPAELAAMLTATPGLVTQLHRMDPSAVNAWWTGLNQAATAPFSARQTQLLDALPAVFGNLDGIPYSARDHANRAELRARIGALEKEIAELNALIGPASAGGAYLPPALADAFQARLAAEQQLGALKNIRAALASPPGWGTRYLISLSDDHPPLAAVSIGDLDTATSVTYAIPGMGTTTHDMTGWTKGAQNLYDLLPPGSAVVAWIGYETPPVPSAGNIDLGVLDVNRAVAGGSNLAGALGGLAAVRSGRLPSINIVAHSYGTTTAAVALTYPGVHVDTFVTLGSAGLPDNVQNASDLNATNIYSGHARDKFPGETESGDQWAWTGRDTSRDHHVNPIDPGFGSHSFGVETGGDAGRVVTDHSPLLGDDGPAAGYLDKGTESLKNTAYAIAGNAGMITANTPLGPTNLQKSMMGGLSSAR